MISGCATAAPFLPDEGMHWSKFYWTEEKDKASGKQMKRAAMFVPIAISGCTARLYAQLDTGANRSILSGSAVRHLPETCRNNSDFTQIKTEKFKAGVVSTKEWAFQIISVNYAPGNALPERHEIIYSEEYNKGEDDFSFGEGEEKGILIGSVGMDYFQGKQLVIDYPGEQFTILEKDVSLPDNLRNKMKYVPMSIVDNRVWLPIEIAGHHTETLFDTGSSLFSLVISKKPWQRLTGKTGDEPTNIVVNGTSWDEPIRIVGALLRKILSIGGSFMWDEKSNVEVFFIDHEKASEWDKPVIGNALFWDDSVIVLDLANKRFGRAIVR